MTYESVLHLIDRMVERTPDQVAISRGNERITYRELQDRIDQLAHLLLSGGAKKDSIVAILLDNRVDAITSILAVLKAGAVFVPLDSQVPNLRLETIIAEITPDRFITDASLLDRLNGFSDDQVLNLDRYRHVEQPSGHVSSTAIPSTPDDFCYIYFTSGSTGRPKSIAGRLKGIDHFIRWEIETLGIREGDRVSQLLPLSFDGSLRDIFVPLCAGGTICVPEHDEIVSDARELVSWLERERISLTHCVPTLFRALLNEDLQADHFPALRYVLLSGEALLPVDVGRWMEVFGQRVKLINLYGTSETTMAKFIYHVQPGDEKRWSVPVGKPMPGARALLVDEDGRICPPGAIGEIYIRTPYRSLGYYKQPELTSEVFIINPFNNDPADIVYKTGDLGRMLEDGNIELLGRRDQQVKIRGVRVELEEINNLLRGVAGVNDVAVVDQKDASGGNYLCAYVVGNGELNLNVLREYLQERLPNSMVPSAFVFMERLPRTISGKLDRRALRSPRQMLKANKSEGAEPLTAVEEVLASLWSKVLGLEQVGVHDNFFELGGHSLLATQVLARIRDVFHAEIALRQLFETPTVFGLAQAVEIAMGAGNGLPTLPIKRVSRGEQQEQLPLSYAQQRLWIIDELASNKAAYNVPGVLRFLGALNVTALEQTIGEIIRRHETLRTVFVIVNGQPSQVVAPNFEFKLPLVELSNLPPGEREKVAAQLAVQDAQRPFDLRTGPLLRVCLLRLAEQEHHLLFVMHHIISDAWSTGVLVRETGELYKAHVQGLPAELPELAVQYADYAQWQREWMNGEVLSRELAYWKQQLAGAPPVLELPTDRPRPPVQSARGATCDFTIDRQVTTALKRLGRQEGATLFMLLIAAFNILFHRYTGQTDIVIGTPIANRTRSETNNLIGFFVNTLILRTDMSGNPSFLELLRRVREIALGAYAHQHLPFERLVEELQPERNLSHTPVFQVMLTLHNAPVGRLELPGLDLNLLEIESGSAKFDLNANVQEIDSGLAVAFTYSTDLFDASSIQRLGQHLKTLLASIVEDADKPLVALSLLTPAERDQILVAWNGTKRAYDHDSCLHELFEEQAARTPDALALTFEGRQLTYGQLNDRANQLARHLQRLGVGPEVLVGVLMERSLEMVVALMGILKSGGAYLPLDPSYPQERLRYMLADAGLRFIICHQAVEAMLPALLPDSSINVLSLDAEWATVATQPTTPTGVHVTPDNLAYVLYTSGSTGQPKGVMISQRAISNHMLWMHECFPLKTTDAVLQKTPFSFDASVWEFYAPLLAGARLVIAQPGGHQDAAYLVAVMEREGVTRVQGVPTLLRMLVSEGGLERCTQLREVFSGGEVLRRELAESLLQAHSEVKLYNLYGPTEATIDTTWREAERDRVWTAQEVGIGQPIANVQVYVLDTEMQVVPVGVVGELYIGGAGLARGYLNRPTLTAERFVPHPFSERGGARLYRTGDMVRWLDSGELAYVSRVDAQVKVRGFRVELGEIEAVLRAHPSVKECIVLVKDDKDAGQQLVGYILNAPEELQASGAELRAYLQERLPEYMVPAVFMIMDEWPLTPSGKVDFRALPEPEVKRDKLTRGYLAPDTPVQQIVAGIWADLLKVEVIGANDNFFDLGGHSLLATQVISRMRDTFKQEFSLRSLFGKPTVAEWAASVEMTQREGHELEAPPIVRVSRDGELPLSFAQQRLWFLDQLQPGSAHYNIPFAVRLTGQLDVEALKQTLFEIVRRHEVLRTTFASKDGRAVQIISPAAPVRMETIDLSASPADELEEQVEQLTAREHQEPFDLAREWALRAKLLRLSAEEHIVLFTLHHVVSDAWSIGVLVQEVASLYEAFRQGQPSPLVELPIQYADFAAWQREWLQGEALEKQLSYWREQLLGAPAVLELPTDRPRPAIQTVHGKSLSHTLPKPLSEALKELSRRHGTTLFMTMLAALNILLSRYSGQDDIVVGTTIANRNRLETERLIGFFVNTLVLRTDLSGDPTFVELLQRVREVSLGAYAHQDLPFEKLVEELQPERDLSRSPLTQIVFTLQNAPLGTLELPGLSLDFLEAKSLTSKFDIVVDVTDREQSLFVEIQYNTDLFNELTIQRMMEHLEVLLQGIVERPTATVAELPLLTAAERRHLLLEWNETAAEYPLSSCIHHLFEAQVRRTPDVVAARSVSASLTFAQLDARANQLAHFLLESGIGPQSVVALLLDHSCETVIAILGVLKAGCAYLPLDPSHPPARMAFALADAQAALLMTTHSLSERLAAGIAAYLPSGNGSAPPVSSMPPVLALDTDWQRCAAQPATAPSLPSLSSSTAAYLIYTSGSTGLPKGVVIEHASLVNYICWAQSVYGKEGASADCALYSSLAFDLTVTSIFLPLVTGNTLHLYPPRDAGPALLEVLEDNRCHVLKLTPSHLALISDCDNRDSQIRCLIVGGEALSTELAQAISESFGHQVAIYNEYGPTEATVGCMIYRFDPVAEERAWVPIGRPAANTQIYILDERLEPTAEQVTGELYIGGAGVTRGYLGRAELTAARFVPDPFSGRAGGRLYRTGDRARRLAEGNIEYLGRNDEQVKYHGYRVELNELRLALSAHAKVRDAVVVVRKVGVGGREQLVGYYVGREAIEAEELRRHMQERVIAETVPQLYVHLRQLPLTLNGKVNVEALPAPWVEENGAGKEGSGEPRTEAEAQLVAIWREVLGREQVGIDDNFFELGGDSILSIQIIARANRAGLQLMPRQLFKHPTVAELAAVAGTAPITVSEQGEVSGEAPLTPIQHWFFEQELPVPAHYNQSLLLQTRGPLQAEALKAAVRGLLSQHDALRMRFERGAEAWRQWHAPLSEEMVEQSCTVIELSVAEEELGAAITAKAEEVQRSLDLEHGPLLRVVWLETGGERSGRLLLVAHHLVVDGVSWRVLLEDLERGYEQAAGGEAVALGAKTTSYREWAEALVAEADRGLGAEEEHYWRAVAAAHVADIPRGHTAGSGTVASAERVEVGLSVERTRELLQEVPAAYNTQINDVLVTALARTLSWWTTKAHRSENGASAAVLVEMEGHGREEVSQSVDVSRTVGWFTSIYPVVLESRAAEEAGAALKRVKEQLRAVPRHGLGFGVLRYLGNGEVSARLREMRRAEVGFNYLGQLDQVVGAERWLGIAEESGGAEREASGQRVHAIEVSSYVVGGELRLGWEYDGARYERAEMEAVAGRYREELEELIAHCVSEEAGGFTPSDFPLADLSQAALDRIAVNDGLISDIYTLAPLQPGLLFHSLYTPSSGEYFVQLNCTLSGKVSEEALQQAWQEVVNRHAVLRTFFVWQDLKEPVQIVRQHVLLPWLSLDWRTLVPELQQQQLSEFLAADVARGFDLQQAPLMRLALIRIEDETYHFVWSFHHLLLDGWSTPLVIKEVFTFYEGISKGRRVELSAVRPYREYIRWLRGQDMEAAEQFWRELLKGFSAPTALGVERVVSTVEDQYEQQEVQLTAEATAELQQLARTHQVTLNTVVQGAWALLLSRYSGSEDVVFGAIVSGRPASLVGVEEMVGMFINTLPVRVAVKSDEGVSKYLLRLQEQQVEVRQYEYSPLVEVQGWSEVGRGVRLFDTIMVFENYPVAEALRESSGDIEVRSVHTVERSNYPLALVVLPGQQIVLRLEYNTSRYEPASIARMLQHLMIVLEGMSAQPEPRIADVPLLTITEEQQILFEWNETATEYPRELSLSELFEAQAARTPEAVALLFEDTALSYGELNERANQLARYLQRTGIGPEVLVGILMQRSVEMIVAVLGILKAGGAYVPLDPSYPLEHLAFMVQDSGIRLLLTQECLREVAGEYAGATLNLNEQWHSIAGESTENLASGVQPENLAYVIYTSRSTGRPKGVMIQQRSVVNLAAALQHSIYREYGAGLRIGMNAPLAFDASVQQVVQLLHGHTLCILPEEARADAPQLLSYIKRYRLDCLDCTPSHLKLLGPSGVKSLMALAPQLVLVGGEALEETVWPQLADSRETRFFNIYGSTECTVDATLSEVRAELPASTIGRPLPNVQMYVLDQRQQPVGIGIAGEIYIGGDGVGRGYLNQPELTAERFIPHPYSGEAGARLYRTGDVGRYLRNSNIQYIGRLDDQVKLRGFRIQLGEIETVLTQHPAVRQVVLMVREDQPGDKRLACYIVAKAEAQPDSKELRRFLRNKLPDHMIPTDFMILESLPLNPHGKVERGALPAPDGLPELDTPYLVPRTEVERNIAEVWREVLGLESVGMFDHFFDLGGHSLLMVQVHHKLRERFKFEVSLVELYEYPSINSLAEHLSREKDVTPIQDENLVLATKLREGKNRLTQQRATRA